jgi:hypothetical protein
MDQTTLRYDDLIESHLEHPQREYRHQLIDDATLPQFWFLTTTFVPVESKRYDHIPIPPHRCFVFFERFYVRLLSKLMNNFGRKRWLQPLTYAYIDYPFTKRMKTFATLSPIEQFRLNQFHFYPEHPEMGPHVHSIMLIKPQLVERFEAIRPKSSESVSGTRSRQLHAAHCSIADACRCSSCDLLLIEATQAAIECAQGVIETTLGVRQVP